MNTKFRFSVLALVVAIFSVQCSPNSTDTPQIPTTVEQHFKAGTHSFEGVTLPYQETTIQTSQTGKHALVVVLHGQYANGSDNKSQINQDAMIRIWHYLSTNNVKAVMLAPQCSVDHAWDERKQNSADVTMSECLRSLIDSFINKKPNIDASRIYIVGYSDGNEPAGGGGVWRMLSDYSDLFAGGMSVAADPDNTISALNVAKTPVLSVKGITDIHAVALTLDSFGDQVRDAGGTLREDIVEERTREAVCREAFSKERLDWLMQFSK